MNFSFAQIASAFIVLFAIVDPFGNIPVILNIEQKGVKIQAEKIAIIAYMLILAFFFAGDWILGFFHVDIRAFAVAGALILFLMALEMLLDVEIFKNNGPEGTGSIVPLAFPLIAGPGVFTSLLTLRSMYETVNILVAITFNMIFMYFVLKSTRLITRVLGESGVYIARKFFGLILITIAIKLFAENISALFTFVN